MGHPIKFMYSAAPEIEAMHSCYINPAFFLLRPAQSRRRSECKGCKPGAVSSVVPLPGPCCVVLAMIHFTRQHFMSDLRVNRGFCHFEPSVCPPGFGSFPLASGSRSPSAAFSPA